MLETAKDAHSALTLSQLMEMNRAALEDLYSRGEPRPIPDGESNGRATLAPGTATGRSSEAIFGLFWQGKVFDRKNGMLVNKILGVLKAAPAKVFVGASWFDDKPSILIDYKGTSWLCAPIRDEIRMVAADLYLGFAYVRTPGKPRAPLMFALDFSRS